MDVLLARHGMATLGCASLTANLRPAKFPAIQGRRGVECRAEARAFGDAFHRVFSVVQQSNFAAVLSTDERLGRLATGQVPEREKQRALARQAQSAAA